MKWFAISALIVRWPRWYSDERTDCRNPSTTPLDSAMREHLNAGE